MIYSAIQDEYWLHVIVRDIICILLVLETVLGCETREVMKTPCFSARQGAVWTARKQRRR